MTISAKTPAEYRERMVQRDEGQERAKMTLQADLDRIERANLNGILEPYMDKPFVKKYLSKIRLQLNHPHVNVASLSDLYTEFCSRPPSIQFMLDFFTSNPSTHQIAQQYGILLHDKLTFIEHFNPEKR